MALERYYTGAKPQAGSVQACMWMLVLNGQVGAKQFICKSDPFAATAATVMDAGGLYDNFRNGKQLSYSMAYPWNAKGEPGAWWANTMDAGLPLIADMTPRQGTGTPKRDVTPAAEPTDGRTGIRGITWGRAVWGFRMRMRSFAGVRLWGRMGTNIFDVGGDFAGAGQVGGVAAGAAAPRLMAEKGPFAW